MSNKESVRKVGVVLMTYGSATTADGVQDYFESIYRGKAPEALIEDFKSRYKQVGHSPLIEITQNQAAALEKMLGDTFVVRAGMRHSAPFISDAVKECKEAGAKSVIGIILSPQIAELTKTAYGKAFFAAAEACGYLEEQTILADSWHTEPTFIELLVARTKDALAADAQAPVIFTTHSLPKQIIDNDPNYLVQLQETIDAVREQLDANLLWYAAYQSAGHSPEPWLTPDVTDILNEPSVQGAKKVIIVPIQFLADHLEILYDLDIALKKQCDERDITYTRIELPNTDSRFIQALASVTRRYT